VSQEITLREDEISDVSLATFHVFDKESNPASGSPAAVVVVVACSRERPRPRSETRSIRPNRIARPDGHTNMFRSIHKHAIPER
jgi:hypothetical protein